MADDEVMDPRREPPFLSFLNHYNSQLHSKDLHWYKKQVYLSPCIIKEIDLQQIKTFTEIDNWSKCRDQMTGGSLSQTETSTGLENITDFREQLRQILKHTEKSFPPFAVNKDGVRLYFSK